MTRTAGPGREGSLEAPTRHPIDWRNPQFYDEAAIARELTRVFDICHGCRRCFNLCQSFPTLFDAIDATAGGELSEVDPKVHQEVVDHCYLCDMCFMTKCPYVPPHAFNIDFPHLMLRAKAARARRGGIRLRDRVLAATDALGSIAGIPVVAEVVNAVNRSAAGRALLSKVLGVHPQAPLPTFHSRTARERLKDLGTTRDPASAAGDGPASASAAAGTSTPAADTARPAAPVRPPAPPAPPAPAMPAAARTRADIRGRVGLFITCYGNRNDPDLAADLVAVYAHNGIPVRLLPSERCCGMPRLELGDLEAVARLQQHNIPVLAAAVEAGYDIVAPIPSCVLMFRQELPLMFPQDAAVKAVAGRIYDPFEYLMLRHAQGLLRTDFVHPLGKVSYHVPCHLRVQNIGLKTRDVLRLVPGTTVEVIERCSGHDGTYAIKQEFRAAAVKIGAGVARQVQAAAPDHVASDCPMAGEQIGSLLPDGALAPEHPWGLLRRAYGI